MCAELTLAPPLPPLSPSLFLPPLGGCDLFRFVSFRFVSFRLFVSLLFFRTSEFPSLHPARHPLQMASKLDASNLKAGVLAEEAATAQKDRNFAERRATALALSLRAVRGDVAKLRKRLHFLTGSASPEMHSSAFGLALDDASTGSSSSSGAAAAAAPQSAGAPSLVASPPKGRWRANVYTPNGGTSRSTSRLPQAEDGERESVVDSLRALRQARDVASSTLARLRVREKRVAQRESALRRREAAVVRGDGDALNPAGAPGEDAPLGVAERRRLQQCLGQAYELALSLREARAAR